MSRLALPSLTLLSTLVALAPAAHADRRAFGHTYEYQTMPQGGLDLEIWNTQTRPDLSSAENAFELMLEIEYGITDHWDLAFYQIFAQDVGGSLGYDATALETRYRFAERGEWPIDTLAYFEIVKPLGKDAVELEGKAILARDFGPFTLNANLIAELLVGDETYFIPGWAVGLSYEPTPAWRLGVETLGEYAEPESKGAERHVVAWAGPSLSWAPSPKLWITGSAVFGLTEASDDLMARLIFGISL
jgi:hypothetical protein